MAPTAVEELVLLAWVVEELGKVVLELDELVLLVWVVIEELVEVVAELDELVLLVWVVIEELVEVVTELDELLVVEGGELLVVKGGEPPGLCSYSVCTKSSQCTSNRGFGSPNDLYSGIVRHEDGEVLFILLASTIKLTATKYHCDVIDSVPAMSTSLEQLVNQASTPQSSPLEQQAQKVEEVVNVYPLLQIYGSPAFRYQRCSPINPFSKQDNIQEVVPRFMLE
jgi:hypothetical protein